MTPLQLSMMLLLLMLLVEAFLDHQALMLSKASKLDELHKCAKKLEVKIIQAFTRNKLTFVPSDKDINKLIQICRKSWQEILDQYIPRYFGTIDSLPPNQAHGWIISDEGNRIFFLQKELPLFLRKEKQRVSFILQDSYDRKRDRKSVKATDFRI